MTQYPNIISIKASSLKEILTQETAVIVEFGTIWSGASHIVAPILNNLMNDFPDIKMFRLDVEESPEIARDYGIFEFPTYLFFRNGILQDHVVGITSRQILNEKLQELAQNK
ncbi:MAG: thioredoxin family protein [Marinifilaceae bacterium]